MPPHATSLEPAPDAPLKGDEIVVHGYSLGYAAPPRVHDATADRPVEITVALEQRQVGRGLEMDDPPPGSIQLQGTLRIRLAEVIPGHTYTLDYLGDTFSWVAS